MDKLVLVISHSNYLHGLAGTEKCILEQLQTLHRRGIGSVHLFPSECYSFLGQQPGMYGINLNDRFLGFFSPADVVRQLQPYISRFVTVYVHHLMSWQNQDFCLIAGQTIPPTVPRVFFAHDFYSSCPGAFLPCHDAETGSFCDTHDNPCSLIATCADKLYRERLRDWRGRFREVLAWTDEIVVPSQFVKQTMGAVYPHFEHKIRVWGHLRLVFQGLPARPTPRPAAEFHQPEKPRLAFLGYKAEHKGWRTWMTLFNDPQLLQRYKFFHVGSRERYSRYVTSIAYSYHDGGAMAAVRQLERNQIDFVLLWSQVPESYSYTLYEALAAGVPVLTSRRSGNIASTIDGLPTSAGLVFDSSDELFDFLRDVPRVKALLEIPRFKYRIEPAPYLGQALSTAEDLAPGELAVGPPGQSRPSALAAPKPQPPPSREAA